MSDWGFRMSENTVESHFPSIKIQTEAFCSLFNWNQLTFSNFCYSGTDAAQAS